MLISAIELLKQSVNLYKNNFVIILKYLLLTLIPTLIAVLMMWLPQIFGIALYSTIVKFWWLFAAMGIFTFLLVFILGIWSSFNLMRVIKKLHNKEAVASVVITTKETEKVVWNGICTSLLVGVYTATPFVVGALLLILNRLSTILPFGFLSPMSSGAVLGLGGLLAIYGSIHAIIFSLKLFPATYETVLAEKPTRESIASAFTLTKNRWWTVLGRLLLTAAAVWFAYMVLSLILTLILKSLLNIFGAEGAATVLIYNIFMQALSLLITPVAFAAAIILYEELKKLGPAQTEQKI